LAYVSHLNSSSLLDFRTFFRCVSEEYDNTKEEYDNTKIESPLGEKVFIGTPIKNLSISLTRYELDNLVELFDVAFLHLNIQMILKK